MKPPRRSLPRLIELGSGLALAAILAASPSLARADCAERGAQAQVLVKPKTAIRRGPGLNYPVSAFIDEGRCMRLMELSADGTWIMVEDPTSKAIGWVPLKGLDAASAARVAKAEPRKASPIGSGVERGYVSTLRPVGLLASPKRGAKDKRTLPASARLLALAVTTDGAWIQVRDERNEVGWVMTEDVEDAAGLVAGLPVADSGLATGSAPIEAAPEAPARPSKRPSSKKAPEAPEPPPEAAAPEPEPEPEEAPVVDEPPTRASADGPGLELRAMALFGLPQHGLESDGVAGIRRYAVRANAAGVYVEGLSRPISMLELRLSYGLLFLGGIATAAKPDETLSAQQHDLRVLAGVPIALGPLELAPELGYSATFYAVTESLPSQGQPTFASYQAHLGTVGARASVDIAGALALAASFHGLFGVTAASTLDLGSAGLTAGYRAGAEALYRFTSSLGVVARWELRGVTAPFTGPAPADASITEAKLLHVEQQGSIGLSYRF